MIAKFQAVIVEIQTHDLCRTSSPYPTQVRARVAASVSTIMRTSTLSLGLADMALENSMAAPWGEVTVDRVSVRSSWYDGSVLTRDVISRLRVPSFEECQFVRALIRHVVPAMIRPMFHVVRLLHLNRKHLVDLN